MGFWIGSRYSQVRLWLFEVVLDYSGVVFGVSGVVLDTSRWFWGGSRLGLGIPGVSRVVQEGSGAVLKCRSVIYAAISSMVALWSCSHALGPVLSD